MTPRTSVLTAIALVAASSPLLTSPTCASLVSTGDIDNDRQVGIADLLIVLGDWG